MQPAVKNREPRHCTLRRVRPLDVHLQAYPTPTPAPPPTPAPFLPKDQGSAFRPSGKCQKSSVGELG